jgi:methylenetetrahydrofolate--tRNA-(uracil-5-)-methyltransferase
MGGIHRNTFLNSPALLDRTCRLRAQPRLRFAGQITGVEGYVESAAMGLLTGRFAVADRLGHAPDPPPPTTSMGTLLGHITGTARHRDGKALDFQPMNANFGLFPLLQPPVKKKQRKAAYAERALADLAAWLFQGPLTIN